MNNIKFLIIAIALILAISCSREEVGKHNDSLKIKFSSYLGKQTNSKAESINIEELRGTGIGILAWNTGENNISFSGGNDAGSNAPDFINNQPLSWNPETSEWETNPDRYWPTSGDKISFYAYAPYTDGTSLPESDPNYKYHPENITYTNSAGAHILKLTVPYSSTPASTDKLGYDIKNQTDFIVARRGTDYNTESGYFNGHRDNVYVGVNQNLNKDYYGAVQLQMRHALSKISFAIKAGNREQGLQYPYTKVVIDKIQINGDFSSQGSFDLYNETWDVSNSNYINGYTLENSYREIDNTLLNDPFNPIADEVYNITPNANDINTIVDEDGWYKLNKSSHNLLLIPHYHDGTSQQAAQIKSITGRYTVYSYSDKDKTGNIIDSDIIDFEYIPQNIITLEAGKAYSFRFNIELQSISFGVSYENWEENNYDYDDDGFNSNDNQQVVTSAVIYTKDGENTPIELTPISTINFSGNTMIITNENGETRISLDNIDKLQYQNSQQ